MGLLTWYGGNSKSTSMSAGRFRLPLQSPMLFPPHSERYIYVTFIIDDVMVHVFSL